jgi:hypothetical protein
MSADALFTPTGDGRWLPTDFARGPWSPDALHGGPTAALLARAVEPLLTPLPVARMTVELIRPVPVAPLTVTATLLRDGRKIRLADARIEHDGNLVAWATVLGIRNAPLDVPDQPVEPPAPPSQGTDRDRTFDVYDGFHNAGVEHRFVGGVFGVPGPATDWIRLRVPVVPDEEPSPVQRTVAAADFGNGISAITTWEETMFINADLTVHLHRQPVGEWICLDAQTRVEANGVGLATSQLFDEKGPIGQAVQSLLVESR